MNILLHICCAPCSIYPIEALRKDRTCLIIAHRLSTVIGADVIYVMREGRIVARGTHAELLRDCTYYSELAQLALRGAHETA